MYESKLIGKRVDIIDEESIYCGHWGYIVEAILEDNEYHISGGSISTTNGDLTPIFTRDQFKVRRIKK